MDAPVVSGGDEDAEQLRQGLKEFHEILQSIPDDEKRAYLKALDRCPELIERETNPLLFLKHKHFQVWDAVQAFLQLWERRLTAFGESAFLPINFTGRGALSEKDLACMESGQFLFLPDDIHGNPTILIAPAKSVGDKEAYVMSISKVSFSIRLACAHRQTREGYNVVWVPSELTGVLFKRKDFTALLKNNDLIPAPERGLFTVIPVEDPNAAVEKGLSSLKKTFWKSMKPLSGISKDEIYRKLKDGGFRKEGIPEFLGGTWDGTEFLSWLNSQKEGDPHATMLEAPHFAWDMNPAADFSTAMDAKLRDFHRILDSFPNKKKQAYLRARELCPHLIERESHPILFLRQENMRVDSAVEKCINFWNFVESYLQTSARFFH